MTDVRCTCGKMLGERSGARLIIRRLGLIVRGGVHTWDCTGLNCGRRMTVDLDSPETLALACGPLAGGLANATSSPTALEARVR